MGRPAGATRELILDAARSGLLDAGYAGLSTRRVAEGADVPLSQLHYHFGGKQQLILSVLARENERLLERQARMYGQDRPLSERYDQACDFLEDDLASGYVRVLQEMIAAGWANAEIAVEVRRMLQAWIDLLTTVAQEVEDRGVSLGVFSARELGALCAALFMGGESLLLLGMDGRSAPLRRSLRRVGQLIRQLEDRGAA